MNFIYLIQAEGTNRYKIGFAKDVSARLSTLQIGSPFRLVLLATRLGTLQEEQKLHKKYAIERRHGEWFEFTEDRLRQIIKNDFPSEQETEWRSIQAATMWLLSRTIGIRASFCCGRGESLTDDLTGPVYQIMPDTGAETLRVWDFWEWHTENNRQWFREPVVAMASFVDAFWRFQSIRSDRPESQKKDKV